MSPNDTIAHFSQLSENVLEKKAPTNNEDRNLDSFGSSCWNVVYFMGVDCNFAEHSNGILLHFTIYSS